MSITAEEHRLYGCDILVPVSAAAGASRESPRAAERQSAVAYRGLGRAGRHEDLHRGDAGIAGGAVVQPPEQSEETSLVSQPRRLGRQLCQASGEGGETDLIRVPGRQGDLDAGDHLRDAPGDLDQAEPDVSNWASRQNEMRGARLRKLSSSQ